MLLPILLTEDEYLEGAVDVKQNPEASSQAGVQSTRIKVTPTLSIPIVPSKDSLKSSLYADEFIAEVDKHYLKVAFSVALVWSSLCCIAFYIGRKYDSIERLSGIERKAPMVASMLLGMSLVSSVLPLLVRGSKRCLSGVVICAVVVQCIAFSTDLLIAFFPTPVLIDPVCGTKVYLLRYCEWAPLAFAMAFLTESCRIDDPTGRSSTSRTGRLSAIIGSMSMPGAQSDEFDGLDGPEKARNLQSRVSKRLRPAYALGCTQGLSTGCALIFPLCPGPVSWTICLFVACCLFSFLFIRLRTRTAAFRAMKEGTTLSEQEMYNWTRLSLGLLRTCSCVWSILVAVFFVTSVGPVLFPSIHILKTPGLAMLLESTLDVLFKAIYLLIVIDVHDTIFDPSARAERRLEELRQVSTRTVQKLFV